MTKGYLLFALDNSQTSYSKLATACALSIKNTQPNGYDSVSVVTNNRGYFQSDGLFDHIISSGKLEGMDARAHAYDLSPYNETVLLDSDMLILQNIDHYWEILTNLDLFVSTSPQTYRRKLISYGYYRKIFFKYKLPDVYSAFTYFKKSDTAKRFFDLVKTMTDNPKLFIDSLIPDLGQDTLPTDEAFALALTILDLEHQATYPNWQFPRITHMKSMVQGWNQSISDWHEKLQFTVDQMGQVRLGVWNQVDILHYVKKEMITDSVISTLRNVK
jgi:hypothetical protein